ncbi:MAG: PAS domain S-box protein [Anaerolineales bacterium]|jgi:PAS domain S-box-containing protein
MQANNVLSLQESESRYRRLFEAAQDGILILDVRTGLIEDVNPYLITLLGFSRSEFIKKKLWEVGAIKDIEASKEAFEALQDNEYIRYDDLPLKAKDGKLISVEFVSNVYRVGGKKVIQCNIRNITARKLAQAAQHESEENYHLLVEALPDSVIVHSQGRVVFANLASAAIIGATSPSELIGQPVMEFVHPDFRELVLKRIQQSLNEKIPASQEEEIFVSRDGRLVDVEVSAVPFIYDSKPAMLTVFNDITTRKKVEQSLLESEERYRQLLDFSPDAIVVHSKGKFVFLNPAAVHIYGAKNAQELLGKAMLDRVHPDYRNAVKKRDTRLYKGKEAALLEEKFLQLDGTEVDVEVTAKPFTYQGAPAVQMVIRDITNRKQADEALRLSEEKYRTLVEGVKDGFFVTDAAGVFTFANPALARILDVKTPQMLLGRKFSEFFAPEVRKELVKGYRNVMEKDGGSGTINDQIERTDGTRTFIEVKPSMILKAGQIAGTQGGMRDVTERKVAEEKIKRQLEHLTALGSIDKVITSNFNLQLSLSEILAHLTKELGVDAADILILNPNSLMLEYAAGRGFRTKAILKAQIRLGDSHAGRVALDRQLLQISNLRDETDKVFLPTHLAGEDFVCYYGVPVISKGLIKGVLEVFHRSTLEPDEEWFGFLNTLAGQTAIAIENSTLFESLQRSNSELGLAYDATIEGWSRAMDLRDKETERHTQRVTEMTEKLARLFGLSEAELVQIRWGALLHDIGKMGVPDGILLKPSALTEEEWVAMKKNPTFAYEMLSPISYLRLALDIPYCHHEKWDGSGYPRGLKGPHIPLAARIFAVVDVWDALRSDRPYRPAWAVDKVREHIRSLAGTHFDPQVVDVFMQMLD